MADTSRNVNYNTPANVVKNQLNDGDEFLLIRQTRQGEQPQVWSSGDQHQTQAMFRKAQQSAIGSTLESTTS